MQSRYYHQSFTKVSKSRSVSFSNWN